MAKAAWEKDAEEFGRRFIFGEWESGLLVARSATSETNQRGKNAAPAARVAGKVSTAEFAEVAGVSTDTIRCYIRTWKLAAKDGLVTPLDELTPGGEYLRELPEADEWDKYYRRANPAKTRSASEKGADVVALGALSDAVGSLQKASEALSDARLSDRQRASAEILYRGMEEEIEAGRQIIHPDDLDAELAELLQGGVA